MAEGAETALSIATAHPDWTVYMTFGVQNFDKVASKVTSPGVVICADNDGVGSGTEQFVKKASEKIAERGKDVWLALPKKPTHLQKYDFNDALKYDGVKAVRNTLDKASLYKPAITQALLEREVIDAANRLTGRQEKARNPAASVGQREPVAGSIKPTLTDEHSPIIEHKPESLDTLLTRYVDMVLKQEQLVKEKHMHQLSNGVKNEALSQAVLSHSRAIKAYAAQVCAHPEAQDGFNAMKNNKPVSLLERGGFSAIRERINQAGLAKDDKLTVLLHVRGKAREHSLSQEQSRQRGGRTQ